MVKVSKILEAGGAAPYQCVFVTECGHGGYLRYRFGNLRVGFLKDNQIYPDEFFFSSFIGHKLDGCGDNELFRKALSNVIEFPEDFTFDSSSDINLLENREGQGIYWKQFLNEIN